MTTFHGLLLPLVLLAVGCVATTPRIAEVSGESSRHTDSRDSEAYLGDTKLQEGLLAQPVEKQAVVDQLVQPAALSVPVDLPETIEPGLAGGAIPLSLAGLTNLALSQNPAIGEAEARIRALRGKFYQAGLPPNPTAGYIASEIGDQDAAGQQGAYVGQTFITADKLCRAQAVVAAEIAAASSDLAAMRVRVQTDVRVQFYETLLAQRRVEVARELANATAEAVAASQSLVDAQEIPLAGLLQTEIQQENATAALRTAENRLSQSWRQLAAVVGVAHLPQQPLEGDVTDAPAELQWEPQLARLQVASPELAAALADVRRARRALDLACAQATPNVSTQVSVQQDTGNDQTLTGVQVGMPIPLWNRNQGGIRQAQAELTQAYRRLERLELSLANRLAEVYREYADARVLSATYAEKILPRAKRTFDLVQAGYQQGEVGYLDLLTAQQTYFQTNLTYLDAVGALWQSYFTIDGLLLDESLAER